MSVDLSDKRPSSPGRRRALWGLGWGLILLAGLFGWQQYSAGLPGRLREQSSRAADRGRWEEVAEISARLITFDPHDGDAWLARARALHALGDVAGSVEVLENIPVTGEPKLQALRALAELQSGPQNDPRAAERTLLRILELDPASDYAHGKLISYYALTIQRQALVQEARVAIQHGCEPVETYVYLFFADELDFTNGVEVNRRWLAGDPRSELFRVAQAFHLARALAGGAPREDLELVQRIRRMADDLDGTMAELLQSHPQNLELLAWHIERGIERGNVDAVTELLARLPGQADDDNRFWRYSGWAKSHIGTLAEAAGDYDRALRLNPLDWSTRNQLAAVRRQEQRFDEVEKLQRQVTRARELARSIKVLPNVRSVPRELLLELASYAEDCGDESFAASLRRHLDRHATEKAVQSVMLQNRGERRP